MEAPNGDMGRGGVACTAVPGLGLEEAPGVCDLARWLPRVARKGPCNSFTRACCCRAARCVMRKAWRSSLTVLTRVEFSRTMRCTPRWCVWEEVARWL